MNATTLLPFPPSVTAPDNYSYRERQWRAPAVAEDEAIIFDEPGRVLYPSAETQRNGVCYRAYYFRVTKPQFGRFWLKVKHGGGEESWQLDYDLRTVEALAVLESDARFKLLWVIMRAHQESKRVTTEHVDAKWRRAAAQKRIKTRKTKAGVKVWIVPEVSA